MRTVMQSSALDVAHNMPVGIVLCLVAGMLLVILLGIFLNGRKAKKERELYDPRAHPETITDAWARNRALLALRRGAQG